MTDINRQKFLAELAKLLTFMYEEDRQEALAMYAGMFDEAEDEQALLQALVSPTRQAVVIARAYNAKERKLLVHAQSREDRAEGDDADYIRAINLVRSEALREQMTKPVVDENQFSLFDDDSAASPLSAPYEDAENTPEPAEVQVPVVAEPAAEAPAAQPEAASGKDRSVAEPLSPPQQEVPAEERPEEDPARVPAGVMDEVDAFLADFSLPDDVTGAEAAGEPEEAFIQGELTQVTEPAEDEERISAAPQMIRKPKVFLLILYIILAVPLTLIAVVLLLIPTLLFLLLAGATISAGVMIFSASFSGFVVFADTMVVLGSSIIVLALGLLCLWIFIWFIGGAIVGLIRSVIELGETWCYKEVPAE